MAQELLAVVVGLVVAGVCTGLLIPVLRRAQVMDVPNHRSSHVDVIPRGGGIALLVAVVAATVLGSLADGTLVSHAERAVLGAAVVLALVGLIDDVRSLPSRYRLAAQAAAAVLVAGVAATSGSGSGLIVAVLSVVGYVSYVNAFNFMDGVNGISGLSAVVAGAWYSWLASQVDLPGMGVVALGLVGAALGFLPWNLRGRIFLGDVGSYGAGALVAGLAVVSWSAGASALMAIAPLLVYLADTGSALVARAVRGERLGEPHRGHVYQRLVDGFGWSHLAASSWCAATGVVVCLLVAWDRSPVSIGAVVLALAVYLSAPAILRRAGHLVR